MSQEMSQDQNIDHKDRLTRRQNLVNEYQNQIDREEQMMKTVVMMMKREMMILMGKRKKKQ